MIMIVFLVACILPMMLLLVRYLRMWLAWRPGTQVFQQQRLDAQVLYLEQFGMIPSKSFMNEVDVSKCFMQVKELNQDLIVRIYQSCSYVYEKSGQEFDRTVMVLRNKVILDFGDDYMMVYYCSASFNWINELLQSFSTYRIPAKKEEFEISIISSSGGDYYLKRLEIKPIELDLELYYNDDFIEVDKLIKARLAKQADKGIVLLHGLPGTGKTTYLRHLIGTLNKKVLFISPTMAESLMNPDLLDLLIDNPNSILVIEDAENIIVDRKYNPNSSVSNLLNLSDGLLSDCVNVQIICTFNSNISMVDTALMRKGRLIATYEFGKLETHKARRLSQQLGFDYPIHGPLSLAEITNPQWVPRPVEKENGIGFRSNRKLVEV